MTRLQPVAAPCEAWWREAAALVATPELAVVCGMNAALLVVAAAPWPARCQQSLRRGRRHPS